jgi:hypothetical protein
MRVKIGPHIDWIGPYQIAEMLLFWIPKYTENYESNPAHDKVHKFGEWLAEDKNGDSSYLARFCEWVHSKKKRKVEVRIDKYDTWNMDATLTYIILPMLKQLQKDKHGSPCVDMEDVPEELRCEIVDHDDKTVHARWDWVLNEIIFAFEHKHPENDWEEEFRSGNIDHKFVVSKTDAEGKPLLYQMEDGPKHTYKCDYDGILKVEARIQNGFRLFGKYYQGLWD